jgi:predicted ATPase
LPGWEEPAFVAERVGAEMIRSNFIAAVAERLIDDGKPTEAQTIAQRLIQAQPLHEPLRMASMRASASLGSLSGAVAEYQQYRRALKAANNSSPSEESDLRMQAILRPTEPIVVTQSWAGIMPVPTDRLFGREEEMSHVLELLDPAAPARLVTLVGPGGIGKTRLAVEVGQRLSPSFGGRVGFVSLADLPADGEIARAISGQIGFPVPAGVPELDYLSRSLGSHPTLLILDNLEILQPRMATVIRPLFTACPGLKILATSLTPLRLEAEHCLPIRPLDPESDGAEMLQNLLRASRPVSSVVPGIEDSIRQLSAALDGYPLAIKLAGARLRTLSPSALLAQLTSSSSVLASGKLDLPDRQRSMEAALEWSLQTLSETDRSTLELLAGFPGGVSYDLAQSVSDEPDLLDVLERLVESALLSITDHGEDLRFRLLGPVREFIARHLDGDGSKSIMDRAAQAILNSARERVPEPFGPVTEAQLRWFDQELDNLNGAYAHFIPDDPTTAAEIVILTWNLEGFRGRHVSTLARIQHLLGIVNDPRAQRHLLLAKAELLTSLARDKEASSVIEDIELDFDGDWEASARAIVTGSAIAFRAGHLEFEKVMPSVDAIGGQRHGSFQLARFDYLVGNFQYFVRNLELAINHLQRGFNVLSQLDDLSLGGRCGLVLSWALADVGLERASAEALVRSTELALASKDPLRIAHLRETEGRYALRAGRPEEAEVAFRQSLELWSRVDSAFQMADQMHSLNNALRAQGRFDEAAAMLMASSELWLKDGNAGGLTQGLTSIADIHRQRENIELAREVLSFALAFQAAHHVTLIRTEHEFQQQMIAELGPLAPYEGPLELMDAFRWSKTLA